jgi:hypothetical protein
LFRIGRPDRRHFREQQKFMTSCRLSIGSKMQHVGGLE